MIAFLFCAFIGIIAIQLFYYLFIFGKFAFDRKSIQKRHGKVEPISVIVCAKNQAKDMIALVPILADQNYPDYEIVLINNASNDNTMDIFENFKKDYQNIKIVNVENNETFWGNKKYSLTLGIKVAKNENLLFIEPDCFPVSKDWILTMSSRFTKQKTIVLGYSNSKKIKRSFFNKISRFDSFLSAVQYFSWAKAEKPYTGKGQNLAYKKETFFAASGFINHIKIQSGEDELFINEVATKENTVICYDPNSFTYSTATNNYKSWYNDKVKSLHIMGHFKVPDILKLEIFQISQFLFLFLALILLLFQFNRIPVLVLLFIRYSITLFTLWKAAKKLNEKEVIYWYPFIEIIIVCIQFYIFMIYIFNTSVQFINTVSKTLHWKLKNR